MRYVRALIDRIREELGQTDRGKESIPVSRAYPLLLWET